MHHLYLSMQPDSAALQCERELLVAWCVENGIGEYCILEENLNHGRVSERQIQRLLRTVGAGDVVVAKELSRLGRSLAMLASMMRFIVERGASIVLLDGTCYSADKPTQQFLSQLQMIEDLNSRIKRERNSEAMYLLKKSGAGIGRPKGSRMSAERNVLYGKTEELERLYAEGLNPQKIADRLDVSRGTVANYLRAKK